MPARLRSLLNTAELPALQPREDAPRLSKSRLVHALQCDRRLWLAVHRPELAVIDAATQAIFDSGRAAIKDVILNEAASILSDSVALKQVNTGEAAGGLSTAPVVVMALPASAPEK
jgi:hypothetical protein